MTIHPGPATSILIHIMYSGRAATFNLLLNNSSTWSQCTRGGSPWLLRQQNPLATCKPPTMEKSQFVYFLLITTFELFLHVECKVYSRRSIEEPYKFINLADRAAISSLPDRFRRDTAADSASGPTIDSKPTELSPKDQDFNEAIVHWSGDNSKVRRLLLKFVLNGYCKSDRSNTRSTKCNLPQSQGCVAQDCQEKCQVIDINLYFSPLFSNISCSIACVVSQG